MTFLADADRGLTLSECKRLCEAPARIAGHTVQTREKYCNKDNFEEDRRIVRENHPLMREDSRS